MDDPLLHFRQVMMVSGLTCICLILLLLLLTLWRPYWRRLLDVEGALWKRLGFSGRSSLRKFEESRILLFGLAAVLGIHVLVFASAVGAYAYYKPRLSKRAPVQFQIAPESARRS
jgi:hypothetical protein